MRLKLGHPGKQENLPGRPNFKGETGRKWRVADPHCPPPPTPAADRACAYHKEEPPVDIFLQLASVSRAGVKACDLLHAGPLGVEQTNPLSCAHTSIHDRIGGSLCDAFPALRWHNHVTPRTPGRGLREELLHQVAI